MKKSYCDLCGKEIHKYDSIVAMSSCIITKAPRGYEFHEHCWKRMQEIIRSEEEVRSK